MIHVYSRELTSNINETNSTLTHDIQYNNPPSWMLISLICVFIFLVSCVLTFNIKMCNKNEYSENIICVCCLLYRDLVFIVCIFTANLLAFVYDILCCKYSCAKKETKSFIKKIRQSITEKYNKYYFKIKNSISPIHANMVENTNVNTSIVIEGLNNKQQIISIIVVPLNETIT